MAHMPGPWRVGGGDGFAVADVIADGGLTLLTIHAPAVMPYAPTEPETISGNAHLLAASPDLLKASIEVENWLDNHGGDPDEDDGLRGLLDMLRAAIAKAQGRQ